MSYVPSSITLRPLHQRYQSQHDLRLPIKDFIRSNICVWPNDLCVFMPLLVDFSRFFSCQPEFIFRATNMTELGIHKTAQHVILMRSEKLLLWMNRLRAVSRIVKRYVWRNFPIQIDSKTGPETIEKSINVEPSDVECWTINELDENKIGQKV